MRETTKESMKKRLPWLIILLFLGMGVSSVVGAFEAVVAVLPIVMCFQSLILDMAGNVGTQSLAVTIRVLMDENLTGKQKLHRHLHRLLQAQCMAASIPDFRLRRCITDGCHGDFESGWNLDSDFLPQDQD